MRISGGSAKGRKVGFRKAFASKDESDELRPTSAKVRKAIFDILSSNIIESRFLDLYAGTGAVGIEALSRGAEEVIFVEANSKRAAIIKDMIDKFGFTSKGLVINSPADYFLRRGSFDPFDIIFVDPPYSSEELDKSLKMIDSSECLANGGIVVAEHSSKKNLKLLFQNLRQKKNYRYGDTALTLFDYGADPQHSQIKE
jgi:16S rRNA (guanine(966)-N(2))-methyltransferase RsmD